MKKNNLQSALNLRLLWISGLSIVILLVLSLFFMVRPFRESAFRSLFYDAQSLRSQVSKTIDAYQVHMLGTVIRSETQDNKDAIAPLLMKDVKQFTVLDENGKIIETYPYRPELMGISLNVSLQDKKRYEIHFNQHDPLIGVGNIELSYTTDHYQYLMNFQLDIEDALTHLDVNTQAYEVLILNKVGQVLYSTSGIHIQPKWRTLSTFKVDHLGQTLHVKKIRHSSYSSAFLVETQEDQRGWSLSLMVPTQPIDNVTLYYYLLLIATLILQVLIFTVVFRNLGHRIVVPLQALTDFFKKRDYDSEEVFFHEASGIEEIDQLTIHFEEMLETIKTKDKDLKEFVYIASHDLMEPLRTIESFTRIIEEKYRVGIKPEDIKYFYHITSGTERMKQLIKDLLLYSRVKEGQVNWTHVDLNHVLLNVTDQLKRIMDETHTQLTSDPLPIVKADETHMHQLFQNLISNGIKYSSQAPVLHVGYTDDTLTFEDHGIGIDPSHLDTIFKPFKRLGGKHEGKGTGIGLSIVASIIEKHHLNIVVTSSLGRGSIFKVTGLKKVEESHENTHIAHHRR